MRRLFKKRLLGVPVVILLILALTAGSALAAYTVLTGEVTVEVNEALEVKYSWDNTNWYDVGEGFTYTVTEAYPGECHDFQVQIYNKSGAALWVKVNHSLTSWPDYGAGGVTVEGVGTNLFSTGISIIGGGTVIKTGRGCVLEDAPPGDYIFTVTVERSDGP